MILSVYRFYAPWCGHCKNLKPAYEKAAKNLAGLAKVAAIDCDEESNKGFCGSMGVQGFPTLKIIRPGKKAGRPNVEDYNGPRSAKGIVEAVIEKIPNHVKKVGDKDLEDWLKDSNDTAKAILFSSKGATSALLKSLAVDFLDGISFAQIRDKETAAIEFFGITTFPKLVLLPGGDKSPMPYDGPMKRGPILEFLTQIRAPNPDPAPKQPKSPKSASKGSSQKDDKTQEVKLSFEEASSSHASKEASENAAEATTIVLDDQTIPTESPDPIASAPDIPQPQQVLNAPPPIASLEDEVQLQESCLNPKAKTCVLALLPTVADPETLLPESALLAQASLAEMAHKHAQRHASIFPFYAVPSTNPQAATLRSALGLKGADEVEVIAINARRDWWKHFEGSDYSVQSVEGWIDAIRLGEGKKEKLPDGVIEAEKEQMEEEHDEL